MSLKEVIKFERENLTPEHLKFNRTVLIPLIILFTCAPTVVVVISVLLGLKFGGSVITLIPIFVWAAFMAVYVILFAVNVKKVNKSVIVTRTAELEEKFADMPLEKAKEILIDDGIITDNGFVYEDEVFGKTVLPFEKTVFFFGCNARSTVIILQIEIVSDDEEFETRAVYDLNGALYNFLIKSDRCDFDFSENKILSLLVNDKKTFTEILLKGGKNLNKLLL